MYSAKKTHYQVLGVAPEATSEEIKEAYLEKAKMHHPDSKTDVAQDQAYDQFVEVQKAYDALRTPQLRAQYDASLDSRYGKDRWQKFTKPEDFTSYSSNAFTSFGSEEYQRKYREYAEYTARTPPKWSESFKQKGNAGFEVSFEDMPLWQRHRLGVLIFVLVQIHVFYFFYLGVDMFEDQMERRWYYHEMNEEELDIYLNTKPEEYKNVREIFDPAARYETEHRNTFIDKISLGSLNPLSYLSEYKKQLKPAQAWPPTVSADSDVSSTHPDTSKKQDSIHKKISPRQTKPDKDSK